MTQESVLLTTICISVLNPSFEYTVIGLRITIIITIGILGGLQLLHVL